MAVVISLNLSGFIVTPPVFDVANHYLDTSVTVRGRSGPRVVAYGE